MKKFNFVVDTLLAPPAIKNVVLEVGKRFKYGDCEYILARVTSSSFGLISLLNGNRYWDPCSLSKLAENMNYSGIDWEEVVS